MSKTRIQYTGFSKILDSIIKAGAFKSIGMKAEIENGYRAISQSREFLFNGEFLDIQDRMDLIDIGRPYQLTVTLEE